MIAERGSSQWEQAATDTKPSTYLCELSTFFTPDAAPDSSLLDMSLNRQAGTRGGTISAVQAGRSIDGDAAMFLSQLVRSVARIGVVIALASFAGICSANPQFAFSFDNEDGSVPGTVAGFITLPDGDGTFAALDLTIVTAPAALGQSLPVGIGDFVQIDENTFTVIAGAIDAASSHFFGIFPGFNNAFALNGTAFGAVGASFLDQQPSAFLGAPGTRDSDSSSLRFAAIPEPGTLAILGLGLAGLAATRRRK